MPKKTPEVLEARHTYKSATSNRPVIQYFKLKTQKKPQLNCWDAKMKKHRNSEPKQIHQSKIVLLCPSIAGYSVQHVMSVPKNLQDLGVSGMKKTTASLNICLCSWLRIFQGYLLFL